MGRKGVQLKDVESAFKVLVERGMYPTSHEIRVIIGHGSYSTITRHLREYLLSNPIAKPEPKAIPPGQSGDVEQLWAQAFADATIVYREQEKAWLLEREHLTTQVGQLETEKKALELLLQDLKGSFEKQQMDMIKIIETFSKGIRKASDAAAADNYGFSLSSSDFESKLKAWSAASQE